MGIWPMAVLLMEEGMDGLIARIELYYWHSGEMETYMEFCEDDGGR